MRFPECCLAISAHRADRYCIAVFSHLRQALADICHVRLSLHADGPVDVPGVSAGDLVVLDSAGIFGGTPHSKRNPGSIVPGNRDLRDLAVLRRLPWVETLIVAEFDVLCIGDPATVFTRMIEDFRGHDLAVSFLTRQRDLPDWKWWRGLRAPLGRMPPEDSIYRAFLPLQITSRRMMDIYARYLAAGWRGHFEMLMPTVAAVAGLKVLNLNACRPPYTRYPQFHNVRPEGLDAGDLPAFIHPVKDFGQFAALPDHIRAACARSGFIAA